jgi:hypothetical protein
MISQMEEELKSSSLLLYMKVIFKTDSAMGMAELYRRKEKFIRECFVMIKWTVKDSSPGQMVVYTKEVG